MSLESTGCTHSPIDEVTLVCLFGKMVPLSWQSYFLILGFFCLSTARFYASDVIAGTDELIYNGFFKADLDLDGSSMLIEDLLSLTNMPSGTSGHAFCTYPLNFQKFTGGSISSFSTTFVVAVGFKQYKGHGLAFMLSSTKDDLYNSAGQFLGLPISSSDHVFFAVELDTVLNPEFHDIDNNHVGIDVNSLVSVESHTAGFYDSNGMFQSVELRSGKPIQVWVDYDSKSYCLNVTLAPHSVPKPELPLLSTTLNISSVLSSSSLYAGFSAAGDKSMSEHYVLGWSFKLDGEAQPLDYSLLPFGRVKDLKHQSRFQDRYHMKILGAPSFAPAVVLIVLFVLICLRLRKRKEDKEFEIMCGPPPFTYKELVSATDSFSDRMLLGKGGFGRVYRGLLPNTAQSIAVKRVSPESKQGKREFMAEIAILGRIRHRNLVQLLGYCRHWKELLLVYEFMANGSLDRRLYDNDKYPVLNWDQRVRIIKGVASGLLYLHQDWDRVIIHRDIKASNVLLDNNMNARLSDFGLARLHDHGVDAHTTHVAGTYGYIVPELARLGKATKATDVFAFVVFMMEVVCGRRPISTTEGGEPLVLADWVLSTWQSGSITGAVDLKLEAYEPEDAELVLKLGLLCSQSVPKQRPCMRQVLLYLERGTRLPDFSPFSLSTSSDKEDGETDEAPCPSVATTITVLSGGR